MRNPASSSPVSALESLGLSATHEVAPGRDETRFFAISSDDRSARCIVAGDDLL
jgi:hypothetical protein